MKMRLHSLFALTLPAALGVTAPPPAAALTAPQSAPDTLALAAFADSVTRGDFDFVDGVLVVRDGKTVFSRVWPRDYAGAYPMTDPPGPFNYHDADWHPYYNGTRLHTMQSITKSITSIVFGIAVDRGDIAGIDQPIAQFFPEHADDFADHRKARITIRHLLTMTSGILWPEGGAYDSEDDPTGRMEVSDDWVSVVLAQPMEGEPGSIWSYSSGSSALLGAVFLAATGQDIQDYAARYLFTPLGIDGFHWKRSSGGLTDTEGGLYLDMASLAKVGQLYLDGGVWRGTRLVSAAWVAESVRPQQSQPVVRRDKKYGYGRLWWTVAPGVLRDSGAFFGWGYGGQYVLVLPETRTVAVMTQWSLERRPVEPVDFARRVEGR
jgi:CubicO group peptidase (beta-lactamase class C family)